jgi:hypothetical protein
MTIWLVKYEHFSGGSTSFSAWVSKEKAEEERDRLEAKDRDSGTARGGTYEVEEVDLRDSIA